LKLEYQNKEKTIKRITKERDTYKEELDQYRNNKQTDIDKIKNN